MILAVAIVAGLSTLVLLFWPIFGDWDNFCECAGYALQPDLYSWFKGELGEDWLAEMKVSIWLGVPIAVGYGTYIAIGNMLGM